ncbi:lactate permease LctP family transporter [Kozakia baliensis]|uniref:lactate permease LctP family transporter n=1 Tax=Kozakia baliensis TaxID=153496 RepID=UPI0004978CCA|nr:lactate permease LctP family transporter [Kozakia baliensis]
MHAWQQNYDPLGNLFLSSAVALIPIVFFFLALLVLKLKGHIACTITVLLTALVATLFYKMPLSYALASAAYGFLYGLWPIAWIILAAVFLYKLSVKTGHFEIIRGSIVSVSDDQRIQVLLVAYGFGAFLEGAAGFGAPVAITTALLVGLGVPPLYAGGLCLIANAAPGAFGAMGIPVIVGGQVIGAEPIAVAYNVVPSIAVLSFVLPYVLVALVDGWRGIRETWPAISVAAIVFTVTQSGTVLLIGPELPDIVASLCTLMVLPVFLKVWRPAHSFRFPAAEKEAVIVEDTYTRGEMLRAWAPFIVLTVCVALWSVPPFKKLFIGNGPLAWTVYSFPFPLLHDAVLKMPPVTAGPTPYHAIFKLDFVSSVGTAIMIAGITSVFVLGAKVQEAGRIFVQTLKELRIPFYSIGMVLAFAFLANYSGLSATLALLFADASSAFTFLSPILGWLGVFLTGSDTSSNALFGGLQAATGHQIGVSGPLLVAANTVGGAVGKMISPQSIAVACAAIGFVGREGDLLRFTLKWSVLLVVMVGIVVTLQAYVFS